RTWQATQWPAEISLSTCSFSEHEGTRSEHRVWKRQPDGGLIGLGTSPSRMIRLRRTAGSGMGTAESSASVYGCFGLLYSSLPGAISTILPRYITASRVETGSSATISLGLTARARAMPMRWRWPPENSCG